MSYLPEQLLAQSRIFIRVAQTLLDECEEDGNDDDRLQRLSKYDEEHWYRENTGSHIRYYSCDCYFCYSKGLWSCNCTLQQKERKANFLKRNQNLGFTDG